MWSRAKRERMSNLLVLKCTVCIATRSWYTSYTGLLTATLSILLTNQIALTGYGDFQLNKTDHLTLKMATAEIVEMSVASNSASQYSSHQVIIFIQGMLLLG